MDENQMTRATDWRFDDLTGWYWSEKYDGVRAFWDGFNLWTRGGNVIQAPEYFLNALPKGVQLDGEIWAGRGTFETAKCAVEFGKWKKEIRFVVFDVPGREGIWIERISNLPRIENEFVKVCEFGLVKSRNHASEIAAQIIAGGGEGAMFRNPEICYYQQARTTNLQRIKAKNLFEPWRATPELRKRHEKRMDQERNKVLPKFNRGFNMDFIPFDPKLEWECEMIFQD